MNYPCHLCNPWLNLESSVRKAASWQFHWFAQRQLKLIWECPFRIVRHGVRFDHPLWSSWIDSKKRRFRQVAKVIDDDFLLLGIIEIKAADQEAIDDLAGRSPSSRWRSSNTRRLCWRSFPGAFFRYSKESSTGSCGKLGDPDVCLW